MPEELTSLRNFLETIEIELDLTDPDLTEPTEMSGRCYSHVSPVLGGWVGLNTDTGQPERVHYKRIDEKPVIINAGAKQTVIPPKPVPPPLPEYHATVAEADALYEAMKARFQPGTNMVGEAVIARKFFIKGCRAIPGFYTKWRSRLDGMKQVEQSPLESPPAPKDWPLPSRVRHRIVDT
jgi:hypothetical protein